MVWSTPGFQKLNMLCVINNFIYTCIYFVRGPGTNIIIISRGSGRIVWHIIYLAMSVWHWNIYYDNIWSRQHPIWHLLWSLGLLARLLIYHQHYIRQPFVYLNSDKSSIQVSFLHQHHAFIFINSICFHDLHWAISHLSAFWSASLCHLHILKRITLDQHHGVIRIFQFDYNNFVMTSKGLHT